MQGEKFYSKDIPIILQAVVDGWLVRRDIEHRDTRDLKRLHQQWGKKRGELCSIALAKELNAILLANDRQAIQLARQYDIEARWVVQILHDVLRDGHINNLEDFVKILDNCINNGLYVERREREKDIETAREIINSTHR